MSKAYSADEEIAQLHEYQRNYIDEHYEDLENLPHPDLYWTLFDAEIEQQQLLDWQQKGVIEKAGTEETDVGEIAYWHLSWPAYIYITQQ